MGLRKPSQAIRMVTQTGARALTLTPLFLLRPMFNQSPNSHLLSSIFFDTISSGGCFSSLTAPGQQPVPLPTGLPDFSQAPLQPSPKMLPANLPTPLPHLESSTAFPSLPSKAQPQSLSNRYRGTKYLCSLIPSTSHPARWSDSQTVSRAHPPSG